MQTRLVVFGLGYTGTAIAQAGLAAGMAVTGVSRRAAQPDWPAGMAVADFADARQAIAQASHVLATAAPDDLGDPVLARHEAELHAAPNLRWAGYLSTTGVYGDRGGAWVDEATPVAPGVERSRRRVAAEQQWARLADRVAVDLFRLAGIYGPGRSVFADLRTGRARLVIKPGHASGRIHRDDIAAAVIAAVRQERPPGQRVLHLADDLPAENAEMVAEAARLLGLPRPPEVPFAEAVATMSPMARSFWAEDRKVSSARTQEMLGLRWRYPTYREGLRAILAQESGEHIA